MSSCRCPDVDSNLFHLYHKYLPTITVFSFVNGQGHRFNPSWVHFFLGDINEASRLIFFNFFYSNYKQFICSPSSSLLSRDRTRRLSSSRKLAVVMTDTGDSFLIRADIDYYFFSVESNRNVSSQASTVPVHSVCERGWAELLKEHRADTRVCLALMLNKSFLTKTTNLYVSCERAAAAGAKMPTYSIRASLLKKNST